MVEQDLEPTVPEADDSERVAKKLAAALAAQNNRWAPEVAEGPSGHYVRLTQPTTRPVDLSSLGEGDTVQLEVTTVGQGVSLVTLAGIPTGVVVQLSIVGDRAERDVRELVVSDMRGDVEVVSLVRGVGVRAEGVVEGTVILGGGVLAMSTDEAPEPVYRLAGGHLNLRGNVTRLCLAGEGTVSTSMPGGVRIRRLEVESDSVLLVDDPRQVAVGKVEPAAGVDSPLLRLGAAKPPPKVVRDRRGSVTLNHVKGVRLTSDGADSVRFNSVHDATLAAPLRVELVGAAEVFNTRFEPDGDDWVRLSGSDGATVLNASGNVELRDVRSLQLTGAPESLHIRDRGNTMRPDDASVNWEDTVLTGVRLPTGMAGRHLLALVGTAYHFTPDTTDLPGRDQTFLAWLLRRDERTNYKGPENARRLLADAEYVRELARVCREKGAPGSVATQAAWCAYRLRALKARGVEWLALGAYRLIGYGERPVPAFLLWLALAVLLAGPVLWAGGHGPEGSVEGFKVFMSEVGRLLLGPLSGLTRSGGTLDDGGDFAEVAARTLTAIPLITGGIALRNYVKSER